MTGHGNATAQNTRLGIWLMIATTVVFAAQDGISRHLAEAYNVYMVVMIRFWFFAAFVMALAARDPGGIKAAVRSRFPWLQVTRGLLLVTEVCVMVVAFVQLGLVESHAVFTCYPLLIAALSGPILGEKVGWRRWTAILIGFAGVLIILQPGYAVFSPWALVPRSGRAERVPVAVGLRGVGSVEITAGLNEGDEVIPQFEKAGVGDRVRLQAPPTLASAGGAQASTHPPR